MSYQPVRITHFRPLRHLRLLVGVGLLTLGSAQAQTAGGYQLTASAGTFTPLTGGTAVPTILRDNAVSGRLPIGFAFVFEGVSYTTFQVSSNGLLGFGSSLSAAGAGLNNTFTNSVLPGPSLPVLAPFWTDLFGDTSTGATARYALSGTAPNQVLTTEWLDYYDVNGDVPRYISFQVKLYETSNRIEYIYRRGPVGEVGDATIGLQGANGSFLSLSNAGTAPGTSTTVSYNRLNRPVTGQVYALAPPATPTAITTGLAASEVLVFPNPSAGMFTVQLPAVLGSSAVQAVLLNPLGQVVRRQEEALPAAGAWFSMNTSGLAAGIYTLRLQTGAVLVTKRVMLRTAE